MIDYFNVSLCQFSSIEVQKSRLLSLATFASLQTLSRPCRNTPKGAQIPGHIVDRVTNFR